jgi:hypothetical protein
MDFYSNQDQFLQICNSYLQSQQIRLERIRALCNFVTVEEGLSPDDEAVSSRILRQLVWLANQCIEKLHFTCKEIDPDSNVEFKISDCKIEDAKNGFIAIFGYTIDENSQIPTTFNVDNLPKNVSSYERILIILDVFKGVSIIPWRNK